jgi:shikimate dehydrogenase
MSPERFAVIGDPIEHSLSPQMQTAALNAAHLEGTYESLLVAADDLTRSVAWLRRRGYRGFNVTVPHKRAIVSLLDRVDPAVEGTGAVNTVVRVAHELVGYNTDIEGFDMALSVLTGADWRGQALVLGAGGAARAVVAALAARGCAIAISNRTREAIDVLGAEVSVPISPVYGAEELAAAVASADLVVNATSLGMGSLVHESPLPAGVCFRPGAYAMDLVYGRVTPFMQTARDGGCRVHDGTEMLVQQGAAAFRLWTGIDPDLDAMRLACGAQVSGAAL